MAARAFDMLLINVAGQVTPALAETDCRYGSEGGFRKTEVRMSVCWTGGEAIATDGNYFDALCRVREQLAVFGLIPQCYGACRNLVLSGMCFGMALGAKGYLARLGQQTQRSDLVSIFAAGPDMELTSVEEQAQFKRDWLRSLGWPPNRSVAP